jgi:hypothetical protein
MDGSRSGMIAAAGMNGSSPGSPSSASEVILLSRLPDSPSAAELARHAAYVVDAGASAAAVGALLRFAAAGDFGRRCIVFAGGAEPEGPIPQSVAPRCHFLGQGLAPDAVLWVARYLAADREDPILFEPAPDIGACRLALHVRTLDDIDRCTKLVGALLALEITSAIGFRELVLNAVEHGNLGITFDEKSKLLDNGDWYQEVLRRLDMPAQATRFASVEAVREPGVRRITVRDQGPGFDWRSYLEDDAIPADSRHGRGISMAIGADFDAVEYRGCGNEVVMTLGDAGRD